MPESMEVHAIVSGKQNPAEEQALIPSSLSLCIYYRGLLCDYCEACIKHLITIIIFCW